MIFKSSDPNVSLVLKDSSIKTMRYALHFLLGVNESIEKISGSKVRKESAIIDIEKCKDAIFDFEQFLRSLCDLGV